MIKKTIVRGENMGNLFLRADEVQQILGVSKSYAYKVIKEMNSELQRQGFRTIAGRVSKQYFFEKVNYKPQAERSSENGSL